MGVQLGNGGFRMDMYGVGSRIGRMVVGRRDRHWELGTGNWGDDFNELVDE